MPDSKSAKYVKLKNAALLCAVLLLIEAAIFMMIIHSINTQKDGEISELKGVFRNARSDVCYLNDGLYYLNGDINNCCYKIEQIGSQSTIQLITDSDKLGELYKHQISDVYSPDSTNYRDYEQWADEQADRWSCPKNFSLVYNTVLEPDKIMLGTEWGFDKYMRVGVFESPAYYVDNNTIKCETVSGECLTFVNIAA